jgi:hypothetical protein
MHNATVKMKDGTTYCAPLWTWRPEEGWMELAGITERIYLKDVESAVNTGQRVSKTEVKDEDMLEKAKMEGWTGR